MGGKNHPWEGSKGEKLALWQEEFPTTKTQTSSLGLSRRLFSIILRKKGLQFVKSFSSITSRFACLLSFKLFVNCPTCVCLFERLKVLGNTRGNSSHSHFNIVPHIIVSAFLTRTVKMVMDFKKWQKIVTLLEEIPNRRKERRKEGKTCGLTKCLLRGVSKHLQPTYIS